MLGDNEQAWQDFLKTKNPETLANIDESWEMHQSQMRLMRDAGRSEEEISQYRLELLEIMVFRLCKVLA